MDLNSIQNSPFTHFSMLDVEGQCCFLCHDGQKVFQMLVDHFKENHFEGRLELREVYELKFE